MVENGGNRKVYLSFLGLGSFDKETNSYGYKPAYYLLGNKKTLEKVNFVQLAELQLLDVKSFDVILIVATGKSKKAHFRSLQEAIKVIGGDINLIEIEEEFTPEAQWSWFEKIISHIHEGDILTVDITHGYRAIPIIFSTALSFLQRAKGIKLDAVYYAAFESNPECVPIVDLKEFYVVSDWAEAISRFSDDLDARKLAELTTTAKEYQIGTLKDESLAKNLDILSNRLRNVEVDWIAEVVRQIRIIINSGESKDKEVVRILLEIIQRKLSIFPEMDNEPDKYGELYFEVQLSIIHLLLTHGLFMQAFTAMREFIAAIGMVNLKKAILIIVRIEEGVRKVVRFFIVCFPIGKMSGIL